MKKFYIVTPCYNGIAWLPGCVRSVVDQVIQGIEVHHHIQDGGSADGSAEWLEQWESQHNNLPGYTFSYESAPDKGMYDAINIAWAKMPENTDITAHLNCDEQYLPSVLLSISKLFVMHPKAEVLLGSYIILDKNLHYICHRSPVLPTLPTSWLNCVCITNSSFYQASAFRARQMQYNTKWRCVSDLVFFRDLVRQRVQFHCVPILTSTFVCTGENLAWSDRAHQEWLSLVPDAPAPFYWAHGFIYRYVNFCRRCKNLMQKNPRNYSIYRDDVAQREYYDILKPSAKWKSRKKAYTGSCRLQPSAD